ncbi:MAG: hypothetical protein MJE77_31715 [Proteobacteria bacterium]|nr:hypothetical protein [Pseudomonadota bacterium]
MSDSRTVHGLGQHPGARFHCVVCRRFVKATERGACPNCGFVPPTLTPPGKADPRVWRRAVSKARQINAAPARSDTRQLRVQRAWPWLALTALALILLAVLS